MKYLVAISIITLVASQAPGQDQIGLDMTLAYMRSHDGSVTLTAEVYDEEEYEPVLGLEFRFYSILEEERKLLGTCLLYTSPSPRDRTRSRMPSSA